MFDRLQYYLELTLFDLYRLHSATVQQVAIVSGICLPILLLLGLTNGHINELYRQLEESPTGCLMKFFMPLNSKEMNELQQALPELAALLPDTLTEAKLSFGQNIVKSVKLNPTGQGDPRLKFYKIDIPEYKSTVPQIAVSQDIAETLNVKCGDRITLHVIRNTEDNNQSADQTELEVSCIFTKEQEQKVTYVPFELTLDIERYKSGNQVLRYGWTSAKPQPQESYAGYLLFTNKNTPISDAFRKEISEVFNLTVREVNDTFTKTLGGLLNDKVFDDLLVYYISEKVTKDKEWGILEPRTTDKIAEQAGFGDGAEVTVIPWNQPKKMKIKTVNSLPAEEYTILGVTLPDNWIRNYLKQKEFFTEKSEPYFIMFPNNELKTNTVIIESLNDFVAFTVKTVTPKTNPVVLQTGKIAVVPARMLSYFYARQHGKAVYDVIKKRFVATPEEPRFTTAFGFAKTINDVSKVVEKFEQLKMNKKYEYKTMELHTEQTRIVEIRNQSHSLNLLVQIVGFVVFLFGVFTVYFVLQDSTDRKRGTIGILRVMGISKAGIGCFIFFRSVCIGIVSVFVTFILGGILKWVLMNGFAVHISFSLREVLFVSSGALFCCCTGSLLPVIKACRIDPFDAISEGRFR
jgi:ABC-type antimicrobial peptide transport system permease subunit